MPSSALTLASHVSDVKGLVFPPERGLLESTPHHTWPNKPWVTSLRCLGASLGLKSHQDSNWDFQQQHLIRLTIPSQRRGQLGIVPLPFWASSFSCLHLCLLLSFGFRVCGTTGAYKQPWLLWQEPALFLEFIFCFFPYSINVSAQLSSSIYCQHSSFQIQKSR